MKKLGLNQIRRMFLEFFETKGHLVHESFSLVPEKDKSLLLINSGMAPLKPYFAGLETPPRKRMTTCQKCIRTGDIDNIGYTDRHGTFFEMLGNFSFGDYFKEQSLEWGWEFITKWLELPEDRIWATVYLDDDEAYNIWKDKIGIPEEHIVRLGKDDNFWEIGIGPCGPCSEIYFDRGEEYGCGKPDCKPGCDCDRYLEFWNHVFTQFDRDEAGNYNPLAHPNIDTGMGLERMACIMQGTDSIFAIDTIQHILKGVERISGVEYKHGKAKEDISVRIITDHVRSVTFMIGDGISPGNEGRGYVLRRLLRRAARHGRLLGIKGPFLAELSDLVIEVSGEAYPALAEKKDFIRRLISVEEQKFSETIDQGMSIISSYAEEMKREGKTVLDGGRAFKLYDTYGFPLDLTVEILAESGCTVDEEGFESYMEEQRELARESRKSDEEIAWQDEVLGFFSADESTVFTGYDILTDKAEVKAIIKDRKNVETLSEGETGVIILDRTPFYAEMGGQAGDTGVMTAGSGAELTVENCIHAKNLFVHSVKVTKGTFSAGDEVTASVDSINRHRIARNHTATHILQAALKKVLGSHVAQSGSSVTPDSLRFDFTHFEAVSEEEIDKIERLANDVITSFEPVTTDVMSVEDAKKSGATALFDEKYGDTVRVVSVGSFSKELCGGTHVANAGQIGALKIISESGIASGVRRIEAITGTGLYDYINGRNALLDETAAAAKAKPANLPARVKAMSEELKALKKELEEIKNRTAGDSVKELIKSAKLINNVKLVTAKFEDTDAAALRTVSDGLKAEENSLINVLASVNGGKVTFLVSVSDDLLDKGYHAGKLIKEIAKAAGGGGGGKADMAQAGAKDPSKIDEAFACAEKLIIGLN